MPGVGRHTKSAFRLWGLVLGFWLGLSAVAAAQQLQSAPPIVSPVDANTVFLQASDAILEALTSHGWKFYTFIGGAARIMFAWDTDLARVDALLHDLKECALQE